MAKKPIDIGTRDDDFIIRKSNTTYVLDADDVLRNGAIMTDVGKDIDNITVKVNGTMWDGFTGLNIGTANSTGNRINIGKDALLDVGNDAIIAIGDKTRIVNSGEIIVWNDNTNSTGIRSTGDGARIVNDGFLQANIGFRIDGDDNVVINSGLLAGYPGTKGAIFDSETGETNRFVNTGELWASGGIEGGAGREVIINKGHYAGKTDLGAGNDLIVTSRSMGGDIDMDEGNDRLVLKGKGSFTSLDGGDGEDTFDLRIGGGVSIAATINGGMDDDVYFLSRTDFALFDSGGSDTIKSTVDFMLDTAFENLTLIGKKAIDGTGNDDRNVIVGNATANRLNGMGDIDRLDGGAGNDVLTGGLDSDVFVIRNGAGADRITDFGIANDAIDLSHYKGIGSFDDLDGRIAQDGDDTVITLLKGDRLRLQDFDSTTLDDMDFDF